jgi:tRNA pseudouridine55 synthase
MLSGYELNQLKTDEFGRVSGILAINKPAGITSHDVVDKVRHILGTTKVGHAGALDPFATGVMLILVGKATKLSDDLMQSDKDYIAQVLFGISTDSSDTEGQITQTSTSTDLSNLSEVLQQFTPEYEQYVSVFSSIKVGGETLRVLARKYQHHRIEQEGASRFVYFYNNPGEHEVKVELPRHLCQIPHIELLSIGRINLESNYPEFYTGVKAQIPQVEFSTAAIKVTCSKGTYIRILAEDIGKALNTPTPAMLIELQRTRVGQISLDAAITIEDLQLKYSTTSK